MENHSLRITEIFHSLQGETTTTGLPTVFVRLTGCPLRCDYCDTAYAFEGGEKMTIQDILNTVAEYQTDFITVTGGEPLAQPQCIELLEQLCDLGYRVSLETSGAMPIEDVDPRVIKIVDLKTPGSGEVSRNLYENINYLQPEDEVKFVICDRKDYDWSCMQIDQLRLRDTGSEILFSPSQGQLAPALLAQWILEDKIKVRMQLQAHKVIWGDEQGRQIMVKKAVVLVSGGLDSSTVLAIAKQQGYECYTLSFDYGQRHRSELVAAQNVSNSMCIEQHKVVTLDLATIGGSALTDANIDVPECQTSGIPITYVPARNTVFLSIALGWAEVLGANDIFVGVNAVDYSGYPDCRPEYIKAFEQMANLATKAGVEGNKITIHAPLIDMTKGQIIQAGIKIGVDYSVTVSCYQADEQGFACGVCDSCRLRKQGFIDAGVKDPTRYKNSA